MTQKLSAEQVRQIEEIQGYQRVTDRLKHLVAELEANRAGQTRVIQHLCETIANETSQMRQRALGSAIGTIADVAGAMSVMAGRGSGILLKIRGLADGVNSLQMQLEAALRHAMAPPEPKTPPKRPA